MPNVQIQARTNNSKQQMTVDVTADTVAPPDPMSVNMVLLMKEVPSLSLNQVSLKSFYDKAFAYFREQNLLNGIGAGDFAAFTHVAVSVDSNGAVTQYGVTAFDLYTPAPDFSMTMAVPVDGFWAAAGWTIEMDVLKTRLWDKFLEDFLKAA